MDKLVESMLFHLVQDLEKEGIDTHRKLGQEHYPKIAAVVDRFVSGDWKHHVKLLTQYARSDELPRELRLKMVEVLALTLNNKLTRAYVNTLASRDGELREHIAPGDWHGQLWFGDDGPIFKLGTHNHMLTATGHPLIRRWGIHLQQGGRDSRYENKLILEGSLVDPEEVDLTDLTLGWPEHLQVRRMSSGCALARIRVIDLLRRALDYGLIIPVKYDELRHPDLLPALRKHFF